MAESFVPSTTGEGQGGAQILSADFTPLNASGIVRGIERASLSLAKQREQQYEKELEAQKKKAAQNKLLQDAQNKTNVKELDIAKDLIYQEYINKAKSDPNFDTEGNFPTLIRDLESVNSLAEGVSGLSKTLSSGSNKISSYINGEYVDNTVPILQSVMSGTLYESDEERIKAIQDGTYTQDINARISQAFSDPNVVMNTDEGVKSAYDELISKAQEQKTISQEGTTLDGKPIIRETKKVITNKQIKDELMNNPTLKTVERNKYAKENNISPLEVDEHLKENGYDDGFIGYYTELVNSQFPDDFEFTEKVGSKTKEGGGKGVLVEGEDYVIDEGADTPVSPREEESGRNKFKRLTPKGKYEIFTNTGGEEKIKAEVKEIKYKDGGYYLTVITANPKETGDVQTFSETEIEGTKEYLNQLKAKGLDVESILKPKEQKVLFYQLPDGTRKTPEEVEGILGEIPPDWEVVTEENKKEMDANRSDSAKKKEQGAVNEEETDFSQYEVVE